MEILPIIEPLEYISTLKDSGVVPLLERLIVMFIPCPRLTDDGARVIPVRAIRCIDADCDRINGNLSRLGSWFRPVIA